MFDDVWTEDFAMWEPFRDALKNYGSQSSIVLATTRKDEVARMMESANVIKLDELSEEDCWSMFSKIAFFDKDPQQCEQLEDFGKQISKKCKGLPLAAKTLGSLMRFKKSREEWRNVLNSNLWELENVERGLVFEALYSILRCKNAYRLGSSQRHGCQEETMSSDSSVKFHFSDH